jgi:hypothetical protein
VKNSFSEINNDVIDKFIFYSDFTKRRYNVGCVRRVQTAILGYARWQSVSAAYLSDRCVTGVSRKVAGNFDDGFIP